MITRSYRRRYGLHASTGILYNHESPRRPLNYLPRKVARGAAEIAAGLRRSWSSAISTRGATGATRPITSSAMWLMVQQDEPDDYVIATGEPKVRDLVATALDHSGSTGVTTCAPTRLWCVGRGAPRSRRRPGQSPLSELGWEPAVDFETLVRMLVNEDLRRGRDRLTVRKTRDRAETAEK